MTTKTEIAESATLGDFIEAHGKAILDAFSTSYSPIFDEDTPIPERIGDLLRPPMGGQIEAIGGAVTSLRTFRGTNIVGEMGTGKTFIGTAAAYLAELSKVLVICPPHLVGKWKREVEITIPNAHAAIARRTGDLRKIRDAHDPSRPLYVIVSREAAKLSYRKSVSVHHRIARGDGRILRTEKGALTKENLCPQCAWRIVDKDGVPVTLAQLKRKKYVCEHCQEPLQGCDNSGPRRYALADYIGKYMRRFFDLLIVDEFHEYKARNSAQGIVAGSLAEHCAKVLALSGTLMGGYSSTLFYLLFRFNPAFRDAFGYLDEKSWIDRYGFLEEITTYPEESEVGRYTRQKTQRTVKKERPGILPSALSHIISNTVFLRLEDVTDDLPPYEEQVVNVEMDTRSFECEWDDVKGGGVGTQSQASAYAHVSETLEKEMKDMLRRGDKRLLAAWLQAVLTYPDSITYGERVVLKDDFGDETLVVAMSPLPDTVIYPKERALLETVRQEKAKGRRVLVYSTHNGKRDVTSRIADILSEHGFRTAVLRSNTVKTDKREDWVAQKVAEGLDVLVTHPKLVQTGLDLIDFPTIVWQEPEYSIYVTRQASRRSWRIGQDHPVKVVYMGYANTMQSTALNLIAHKLRTSIGIEGQLTDDGFAALGAESDDLMTELVKIMADPDREPQGAVVTNFRFHESEQQPATRNQTVAETPTEDDHADELEADPQPEIEVEEPQEQIVERVFNHHDGRYYLIDEAQQIAWPDEDQSIGVEEPVNYFMHRMRATARNAADFGVPVPSEEYMTKLARAAVLYNRKSEFDEFMERTEFLSLSVSPGLADAVQRERYADEFDEMPSDEEFRAWARRRAQLGIDKGMSIADIDEIDRLAYLASEVRREHNRPYKESREAWMQDIPMTTGNVRQLEFAILAAGEAWSAS